MKKRDGDLTEKMTFKQKREGGEGEEGKREADIWRKNVLGSKNGRSKGPGAGASMYEGLD